MRQNLKLILVLPLFFITSCNKDKEIRDDLNSGLTTTTIIGAREAGESGDKQYVPLLLQNANNRSVSSSLRYKGFTVYTEVMFALESIFKVKPPHPYKDILKLPDSVNIRFYKQLWQKDKMNKAH